MNELSGKNLLDLQDNQYSIKRIYDGNILQTIQILNAKQKMVKCLFYENNKLASISHYNPETCKEIKCITYKKDGKTISSLREYNTETGKLLCITFYKEDGKSPSSIVEYDENGREIQFVLFDKQGESKVRAL